jgi:hypothetical protein
MSTGKSLSNVRKSEGSNIPSQSRWRAARDDFWQHVWFAPFYFFSIALIIIFPIFLLVNYALVSAEGQASLKGIFFSSFIFSLLAGMAGVFRGIQIFQLGVNFKCSCGQFYAHNTPWVCGYCQEGNQPDYKQSRYNHLLRHCRRCRSIPLGLWCTSCNKIIQLTQWAVDLVRICPGMGSCSG